MSSTRWGKLCSRRYTSWQVTIFAKASRAYIQSLLGCVSLVLKERLQATFHFKKRGEIDPQYRVKNRWRQRARRITNCAFELVEYLVPGGERITNLRYSKRSTTRALPMKELFAILELIMFSKVVSYKNVSQKRWSSSYQMKN